MILAVAIMSIAICSNVQAQVKEMRNITEMATLGYNVGQQSELGTFKGKVIMRAQFATGGRRGLVSGRCKKGVGCCKSKSVDFDKVTGRIIGVGKGVANIPDRGKLMYDTRRGEDWIAGPGNRASCN